MHYIPIANLVDTLFDTFFIFTVVSSSVIENNPKIDKKKKKL